jgi:hypothetical protein
MADAPSQAHLQGTQSLHTNLTLQKSLPCSYASGTHSATVDTDFNFEVPRRRANIQQGVLCYAGRRSNNELHIAIS